MQASIRRGSLPAQAAIEFVMVLPILFLLAAFAVDVAGLWNASSQIEAASAEGARLLAADPSMSDSQLADAVRSSSGMGGRVKVSVSRKAMPDKQVTMRSLDKTAQAAYRRESATVSVTADVPTLMPLGEMGVPSAAAGTVRLSASTATVISKMGKA